MGHSEKKSFLKERKPHGTNLSWATLQPRHFQCDSGCNLENCCESRSFFWDFGLNMSDKQIQSSQKNIQKVVVSHSRLVHQRQKTGPLRFPRISSALNIYSGTLFWCAHDHQAPLVVGIIFSGGSKLKNEVYLVQKSRCSPCFSWILSWILEKSIKNIYNNWI